MSSKLIDILIFSSATGFFSGPRAGYPPVVSATTHPDVDALSDPAAEIVAAAAKGMHHPLQRHWRDASCARINFPQEDVVLLAAGRAALEEADGGR